MKNINIKIIPHKKQRYETVGDYFEKKDSIEIRVSKMKRWKFEVLVTIHELIEYTLIKDKKLSIDKIDAFDKSFEENRKESQAAIKKDVKAKQLTKAEALDLSSIIESAEPGDEPNAPYHKQHVFATEIEKAVAKELGVDWKEYSDYVNKL